MVAPQKNKVLQKKNNDVTPKEDSPTTPIIEQEESSSNRGKTIILFLLVAILAAIGGIFGYQKYCDLSYGSYEYETSTDSVAVDPFDSDTTAVDTVDTQTKLEEFKNFTSNDLAAFMLHGKVKQLDSFEGDVSVLYTFNEQGKLIDVSSEYTRDKIRHEGNKLIISYQSESGESDSRDTEYEVDSSGRLIRCFYVERGGDFSIYHEYSQFDDNGWPTYRTDISGLEEEKISSHITYKDIDEYGNWTTRADDGEDIEFRTITYYPID